MILFQCTCGATVQAAEHLAGKIGKCPKCGALSRITLPGAPAMPPAPPAIRPPRTRGPGPEERPRLTTPIHAQGIEPADSGRSSTPLPMPSPSTQGLTTPPPLPLAEPNTTAGYNSVMASTARPAVSPHTQPAQTPTPLSRRSGPRTWVAAVLVLAVAIPVYSRLRNGGLRDSLRSCDTYGVVEADVYYDGLLTSDVVVFDLKDAGSNTARRIDPVHLLLQFAGKLDLQTVRRVILSRSGQHIFYILGADLRRVADSYHADGRVWAFNHLAERCYTISGAHAYSERTGGWLVVLQSQTEDLNDLIRAWTRH